jgi:hypothetical protein
MCRRRHARVTDESIVPGSVNRSLRHRAFFEAASHLAEGSSEYRAIVAGLLVLRLLDRWSEPCPATERDTKAWPHDVAPVRRALANVDDAPLTRALVSLVESISTFSSGQVDTRATRLLTYAHFLEQGRSWESAADTYATAIALIDPGGRDADLLPMGYALAARCLRQVGQLHEALALISTGMNAVARQHDTGAAQQREY